jgi:hypothetical protein
MCKVSGLAFEVTGDAAARGVSLGNRREHRMVERGVMDVGFLGKDVAGLAEQRSAWVEDGAAHPPIKVAGIRWGVVLNELPAIRRGSAHDGVCQHRGVEISYSPELPGEPEIECRNDQFESGPAPQRRASCQELAHKGQGRAAQQQAHWSAAPLGGWFEGALNQGRKRRSGLGEERKFIDDHGFRPVGGDSHQPGDGLVPPGEPEGNRLIKIGGERLAELMQGVRLGGLCSGEHKAIRLDGQGIDEKGLALATSARDDP